MYNPYSVRASVQDITKIVVLLGMQKRLPNISNNHGINNITNIITRLGTGVHQSQIKTNRIQYNTQPPWPHIYIYNQVLTIHTSLNVQCIWRSPWSLQELSTDIEGINCLWHQLVYVDVRLFLGDYLCRFVVVIGRHQSSLVYIFLLTFIFQLKYRRCINLKILSILLYLYKPKYTQFKNSSFRLLIN